jgi:hypothetical protein
MQTIKKKLFTPSLDLDIRISFIVKPKLQNNASPKGNHNKTTAEVKELFYTFIYEPEVNSPQVFAGVTST